MIDTYILACMLKNDLSNVGTFNIYCLSVYFFYIFAATKDSSDMSLAVIKII